MTHLADWLMAAGLVLNAVATVASAVRSSNRLEHRLTAIETVLKGLGHEL